MLLLRDKDKQTIIRIATEVFTQPIEIWAYGSRVNEQAHEGSDLDLVVVADNDIKLALNELIEFKERLKDSTIPILVQVMDWSRIPKTFKNGIQQQYVVLVGLNKK